MRIIPSLLAASLFLTASCDNTTTKNTESTTTATAETPARAITLADVPASPEFADAQLGLTGMQATPVGSDSVKISYAFKVSNYDLKAQTESEAGKQCNNSDKGQHIHYIEDNKPYIALYEPKHETTVALNSEHYVLCFLSRSYHESVKGKAASVLVHFRVDGKGKLEKLDNPAKPMPFYSRPKGDYLGKDTANVLLDFYPVNTALGSDYRVKADVTNETTGAKASFTFDTWKPGFLQGLGTGKATVVLSLVDKDGKQAEGPHTTITRSINLAAAEPLK